jgi:ATP-binding cassette, subfamily B, bacterial
MTGLSRLGGLIDAFRPADGPPPQTLWTFMRWCLDGSWRMLGIASVMSALAGTFEVVSALVLGLVIDTAIGTAPADYFSVNFWLLAAAIGFYLLLRPFAFAASSASNAIVVGPNILPLVLSRWVRRSASSTTTLPVGSRRSRCRPPAPSPMS